MTDIAKTPFDLTLHLVSVGGNSDGGWIPGNGYPNPQVGRIGQRYVDVQTGHIYGPKSRDGWPAEYTHTLNLGNVTGEFANMLSRVPALEVRATNLESRTTVLEGRVDSAALLAIVHHVSLQEHGLRIEMLEADNLEIRRRLGAVDSSLSARMLAAEDSLNKLSRLRVDDIADTSSRLDTLTTELNGNKSSLTELQESYTSMSQTWTQKVTTLRSEFEGNTATLQQTLRTHADMFSATSELITTLTSRVDDNQAVISTESRTRSDTVSALAEQITRLSAETASSSAALTSQQTAMANELEAYASSVLVLNAQIGENTASFQEEIQTLTDADQALARRVSTLDVASEELSGRITSEESARISGDSVVLTSTQQMLATSESGILVRISEESAARLSGDQAEAYERSLLETKFTNQGNDLRASITAESAARLSGDQAEAYQRSLLDTKFTNQGQSLQAAIQAEQRARIDAVSAETSSRQALTASVSSNHSNALAAAQAASDAAGSKGKVIFGTSAPAAADRLPQNLWIDTTGGANTPKRWNGTSWEVVTDKAATDAAAAAAAAQTTANNAVAAITNEQRARVDAIAAETSSRNTQISDLTTKINNVNTTLSAAITSEANTRTSAIQAETNSRNQQITSLNTSLGNALTAAITNEATTRASVDGYLGARTTLTTQVSGTGGLAVAGMEISATASANRKAFSQFAIFADRFVITHSQQNTATAPFRVEGGRVYIDSAVIKDASIDTLRIAGNAVSVSGGANGVYSAYVSMYTNVWSAFMLVGTFIQGTGKNGHIWSLTSNGAVQAATKPIAGTTGALSAIVHVGPGSHTFGISCATTSGDAACGLAVIGVKR